MPTPVRKKRADGADKDKSAIWWLRKKVPLKLRPIVGRAEVWRSLGTTERRAATAKCVTLSAELEAEWTRLAKAARADGSNPVPSDAPPDPLSQRDLYALAGIAHAKTRDAHVENPGTGFAAMRWAALASQLGEEQSAEDAEFVDLSIQAFLDAENITLDDARMRMFRPLYIEARRRGYADLVRASKGDFSPSPVYYPERSGPKLDIIAAFETYSEKGGLKGGKFGPTAKRWRPKVAMFVKWLGHRDLARMTTDDGYSWMDHLTERGFAKKSIRDVWIASLSATAGFMVERRKLAQNPFRGIKVRDVKEGKADDEKGFTGEQAKIILTATLAGRSHLISRETYAARRWVPWLCAYSGARVSEITSLWPTDVVKLDGIWCIVIKPELEKTEKHRKVPIHKHVLEQGFLDYVEERRGKNSPLFYDPSRARGGKSGNPQWKKVGERLAEWIHTLGVDGPQPNHAWRHLFKSMARHVGMDREVEGFITGHSTGKTSADYGPRWTKTLAQEIAKYPRFKIAALAQPPAPHKRTRRTRTQIEADNARREAQRGRRRAA